MGVVINWSEDDIRILKENYPIYGAKKCSEILNRSISSIQTKTGRLKLKKTCKRFYKRKSKTDFTKFKVNPDQFINIKNPEVCYILGFIWGDGNIYKNKTNNNITVECVKIDIDCIKDIFYTTGKWKYYTRKRKNRQEQATLQTSNKFLVDFLIQNDYHLKSGASADKIISNIPENLKHYFFRGYFDADGCFFYSEKIYSGRQISIGSTYEQDWTFMVKLCEELCIKYSIARSISKKGHKSSIFIITERNSIKVFGDYIYQGFKIDKIGFQRKYDKYIGLLNNYTDRKEVTISKLKNLYNQSEKHLTQKELSIKSNMCKRTIAKYWKQIVI